MTTHYADHDADTGLTLTVELFALGSDTVAYTDSGTTAQTNRIGTYRSSFTDVAAGTYELRSRVSSSIKGTWYVRFAGTDAEIVTGTTNSIPTVADIASAVWNAGTRTLTSFGTLVADVATAVWAAGTRTITGLTQAALALFATLDTGENEAVDGSVSKLSQGGEATVSDATANKIADTTLRRNMDNVEVSSDGDTLDVNSLYGSVQQSQKSSIASGILTIEKTDGTTLGTLTVASDAAAEPVTGIGT